MVLLPESLLKLLLNSYDMLLLFEGAVDFLLDLGRFFCFNYWLHRASSFN